MIGRQKLHRKSFTRLHTQRVWQAKLGPNLFALKICFGVAVFSKRSITQTSPQADAGAINGALFTAEVEPAQVYSCTTQRLEFMDINIGSKDDIWQNLCRSHIREPMHLVHAELQQSGRIC
jgi:hypothetical protein